MHWTGPPVAPPDKQDACTYGLAGLSVPRFFAFLSLFHTDHLHGADATGSSTASGATKHAPFAPPKTSDPRATAHRTRRRPARAPR